MRTARILLLVLVAALALAAGYWVREEWASTLPGPEASEILFAARFPDLTGIPQPLSQWQGEVLLVNFWATWCPPCRAEIPAFIKLQDQYRTRGFRVVGIAIDQKEAVQAFADAMGINYPVLLGELEAIELARRLGNQSGGLPFSVFIDRQGKLFKTQVGALNEDELKRVLVRQKFGELQGTPDN